jgi:hypothetical protein
MLTQTINLLASARPNLGAAGQGRCTPAAEGGAPTGVGEDNCEALLPAGRGDNVDAWAEATMLRTVGRQGARRAAAAAEPWRPGRTTRRRRMGRRPTRGVGDQEPRRPRQVGEEAARVTGADAADQRRGGGRGRRRVGGRQISGGRRRRRIPWGRGRGAPRKAVVGEDDGGGGGGGHDDDDGGESGMKKWLSAGGGGSLLLYIDTPLVLGRVTNRDKRGAFCHGW